MQPDLQWWMMRHLIKAHNPEEPDPLRRSDELAGHDWWMYLNHCNKTRGLKFWYPRLQGLREENVQWSIKCLVVTKKMVIRAQRIPYLIFAGLRGTRPYAPGRVVRQLGGKQEIPQIADMKKFATDYENGRVSYAKDIRRTWKTRRVLGEPIPNRFRPECSKNNKEWLKKSLAGTIEPEKYDKNEFDHQRRHSEDAKVIAQLKKELRKVRQCMSELDDSMEQQIQSVERLRHQEGARLARDHLWANKYAMWEQVNITKRTRFGESSGGA
ncbi:hypothetical protein KY284_024129 [Solanum tuberosum]|nr:hypothetical protein KY284_024129 [Solanum tuberosum]